jgi:hypothetical protein
VLLHSLQGKVAVVDGFRSMSEIAGLARLKIEKKTKGSEREENVNNLFGELIATTSHHYLFVSTLLGCRIIIVCGGKSRKTKYRKTMEKSVSPIFEVFHIDFSPL